MKNGIYLLKSITSLNVLECAFRESTDKDTASDIINGYSDAVDGMDLDMYTHSLWYRDGFNMHNPDSDRMGLQSEVLSVLRVLLALEGE